MKLPFAPAVLAALAAIGALLPGVKGITTPASKPKAWRIAQAKAIDAARVENMVHNARVSSRQVLRRGLAQAAYDEVTISDANDHVPSTRRQRRQLARVLAKWRYGEKRAEAAKVLA